MTVTLNIIKDRRDEKFDNIYDRREYDKNGVYIVYDHMTTMNYIILVSDTTIWSIPYDKLIEYSGNIVVGAPVESDAPKVVSGGISEELFLKALAIVIGAVKDTKA